MSQELISEETRRQYIVDFKKWLLDVAGFYPSLAGDRGKLLGDFYSGFSKKWWEITRDKLREVVITFESVLPTMVGSIAYLIGAYEYGKSLDKVLKGLGNIDKFIAAVMLPRVRQYKYMLDAGYISKTDFLEYSCCRSMTEFYRRYGADDKARKLVASRQKREISDEQLARGMYLDNVQQVNDVLGLGWRVALNVKENLNDKGVDITYEQSQELLKAVVQDAGALTEEQNRLLKDTADKIREMGLDKLAPKDMVDICDKGFQGAIEEANAEAKPAAAAAASHHEPVLGANAFVDVTGRRPDRFRREESIAGEPRNFDALHANIALAMRRMAPEEKGVASFRTDEGSRSSFQSVSFASPFESERVFAAERHAVRTDAERVTNF